LYKNKNIIDASDPLAQTKNGPSGREYVYERKEMLPPDKLEYEAEKGYKGAHFDHFYNWANAIRNNKDVTENSLFGFRAAAPALLCNESYFENKIMQWDPQNLKLISK
jgi:hypothetical protein